MVCEYLPEAGANYGWPYYEGPDRFAQYPAAARLPAGPPIFSYKCGETATSGFAITAGAFYNPQQGRFPNGCRGEYFFTDICGQWIRRYDPATDSVAGFATDAPHPVNLDVSRDGSLFYLSRHVDGTPEPSGG